MVGLALLVVSDVLAHRTDGSSGSNPLLGDGLVLIGCMFYALSNVGQEWSVKRQAASARGGGETAMLFPGDVAAVAPPLESGAATEASSAAANASVR